MIGLSKVDTFQFFILKYNTFRKMLFEGPHRTKLLAMVLLLMPDVHTAGNIPSVAGSQVVLLPIMFLFLLLLLLTPLWPF
jgi:hypothetical protein